MQNDPHVTIRRERDMHPPEALTLLCPSCQSANTSITSMQVIYSSIFKPNRSGYGLCHECGVKFTYYPNGEVWIEHARSHA